MKTSKISKILGVGLAISMLTSLLTVATPASAGTLSWSEETGKPSADVSVNMLVAGSDVTNLAVSADGSTIYAVDTTGNHTFKSTNGGTTWSRLTIAALDAPALVAIAPGDASVVVVVGDGTEVYLSNDGGVTFSALTGHGIAPINAIALSPLTAGVRYVTVAGISGGLADVSYLNLGSLVSSWTNIRTHADWATGLPLNGTSAIAIAYSPNFSSDKVLTIVTTNATNTNLEIASFSSKKVNTSASFLNYPVPLFPIASSIVATGASIALAPTYQGADETLRDAFVATSTGAGGGQLVRMNNTTLNVLQTATDFKSVAFNGTDLVAGANGSNNVFYSANPLVSVASVTVTNTSLYQRPGGANMVVVAWAGANVVTGTSGAASAFSVSKDKGATFNDISLIDVAMTNLTDVGVAKDGTTVYLVSNDGANTSVWRKTTAWERVLNLTGAANYLLRVAPEAAANVYLVETGSTNMYFSNDSAEKSWSLRSLITAPVDVAVESAQVAYALSGAGRVSKTTNAGFTWETEIATGLTTGATITSVAASQLLVGGTDGTIAWSTDGNASATTWAKKTGADLPTTGWTTGGTGPVHLAADKLSAGGFIYAAMDAADKNVIRWTVGTSTSFSDIIVGTVTGNAKGLVLNDAVLYVLSNNGTNSFFTRTLKPSTSSSSSPAGDWSAVVSTSNMYTRMPSALKASTGKFWAVRDTTVDELHSFSDTTYKTAITASTPADKAVPLTNPASGRAQDIAFSWARLGSVIVANGYQLEIALDTNFQQVIFTANPTLGNLPTTLLDPVVIVVGPDAPAGRQYSFAPDTTYYWRVKAVTPLESLWSVTRSFSFSTLTPFVLSGPAVGSTNVPIKPILSWTAYTGAKWYEVTMSEDPTFAIPEWSHNVNGLVYGVVDALKYGTTYYWRVRGVTADPFVKGSTVITPAGPYQVGAFTTMAEPVAATPPVIVNTVTAPALPPVVITLPATVVEKPAAIPNWMLLTIIVIGAVLVVALIVLIVRTRRVA